jgi:hypothetical protein
MTTTASANGGQRGRPGYDWDSLLAAAVAVFNMPESYVLR